MIESKLKFLTEEKYWAGRNEHYGILCSAHFDNDGELCNFNTNINADTSCFRHKVIKHLLDNDYKRLVIFTRTKKEVGHPEDIPTLDSITKLEKMCRDESIHFYNFIQNPYPEPIYNFVLDSDTFVLRFGFDNGCDIDAHAVKKDIINSTKEIEKNYIIMVTSNDIYIMDEYEK